MVFVPSLSELRNHINTIPHKRDRLLIEVLYLTAARANEITARGSPSDTNTKPVGSEIAWRLDRYKAGPNESEGVRALVLRLRALKHKEPQHRSIALPLHPEFEPWSLDITRHLVENKELRFRIARRRIHQIVKKRK